ncbi:hypothetical protein ABEB36_002107 [Hypothenemus hampei]|uniref:Endoplasmic reticulum junction formation protein lunapark n=1 Tax=Hypothenemus hampei TaxID=57062 RepID=A0ABD1F4L5_HYPHA
MGIIVAKFSKKQSTFDALTKLENDILSIEEFQNRTRQTQRTMVFRFLTLAVLLYVFLAVLVYFYYNQISQFQKLICLIPFVMLPIVLWLIKKFLTWYYNRKIRKNEKKLVTLKEKKKQILETVMETETYKVAKQILDKFGNDMRKPILQTPVLSKVTPRITSSIKPCQSVLRQRTFSGTPSRTPLELLRTPTARIDPVRQSLPSVTPLHNRPIQSHTGHLALTSPATLPSQAFLPQNRSVLDKMVDYLIGDGPSNRYALICKMCSSHNGMAPKEEFEYLSFRCYCCKFFNPARKQRPSGPKFDASLAITAGNLSKGPNEEVTSSSERDSESDPEPIIEEPRSDSADTVKTSDYEKVSDSELISDETSKMDVDQSSLDGAQEKEIAQSTSEEDNEKAANENS